MRQALIEHWITYLALPVLSIILYVASLSAVVRRRWTRHFPWFSAYVVVFLVSVTAVYIDFLLEFTSGETRRIACLIYGDAYHLGSILTTLLFVALVCELLVGAFGITRQVIWTALVILTILLLILAAGLLVGKGPVGSSSVALAWIALHNTVTLVLFATLLFTLLTRRACYKERLDSAVLISALLAYQAVQIILTGASYAEGRPVYNAASGIAFLGLSVVLYWILRRGPERLVKLPA